MIELIQDLTSIYLPLKIADQFFWVLANLACEIELPNSKKVQLLNMFKYYVDCLLMQEYKSIKTNILWAISNFLRSNNPETLSQNPLQILIKEVSSNINLCQINTSLQGVLSNDYFTDSEIFYSVAILELLCQKKIYCQLISNFLITGDICQMLSYTSKLSEATVFFMSLLKFTGEIILWDDNLTDEFVDAGIFPLLRDFLLDDRVEIRREACWILSNISAGVLSRIRIFFNIENILSLIFETAKSDVKEVKKEAIWVICNLTGELNFEKFFVLFNHGIFAVLNDFLIPYDYKISAVCMEALENLLSFKRDCLRDEELENKVDHELDFLEIENTIAKVFSKYTNELVIEKAEKLLDEFFLNSLYNQGRTQISNTNIFRENVDNSLINSKSDSVSPFTFKIDHEEENINKIEQEESPYTFNDDYFVYN
jgi:hypothetical protein